MTLVRIVALGALVVALAACGAAKSPSVASLGTTTSPSSSSTAGTPVRKGGSFLKFANCMRAHGAQVQVGAQGRGISITGGDPSSPQFKAAQTACQKYLPGGGPKPLTPAQQAKVLKQLVKLAKCMRAHGVSDFPDPSVNSGGVGFGIGKPSDANTPQFEQAAKACGAAGPNGGFAVRVRA
jgi:hypothetical protein